MLVAVGLPDPDWILSAYAHHLSGGMKQRAMIAMALLCQPSLIVADEPTTALDVTIQAQVLALLRELRRQFDVAVLLITHNLGVVAYTCDRLAVLYAGRVVESGPTDAVFAQPHHPLYARPARRHPPRQQQRRSAGGDPGQRPGQSRRRNRMRLCPALRPCLRPLPHGDAPIAPLAGGRHASACFLAEGWEGRA